MVPKINVYLPDDLAEAVKDIGVPVSAICQRALETAVRRVTSIRQAALGEVSLDDPAGRMSHFTARARAAVKLALQQAREEGVPLAGTEHLLAGVLAEGGNLAIEVLRAMEIEPEMVRQALAREAASRNAAEGLARDATQPPAAQAGTPGGQDDDQEDEGGTGRAPSGRAGDEPGGPALHFSGLAANALELAVTEAIGLGHNYVGCEHLLLGLISEPDGAAGQTLRSLGAEYRPTRRVISAALLGYTHMQAQKREQGQAQGGGAGQAPGSGVPASAEVAKALTQAVHRELRPFVERLERLEKRLGVNPDA
jgi:ATP-dependent Clp protease ATP-binding subunit ClpA